ncbi:MAG: hypothetical protein KDI56_12855, partial [Xanthomonadales bacterium]|nr:hypothetical protein [Xanthomonadales bacterium]
DGNGDGILECDSGAWEWQGGPDIGAAQSGIYYDPLRSGEGHFLELIGDGRAVLSTFSYGPEGGMAWFIGVGQVVGNSVVVGALWSTRGGVFGAAFDETAIERFDVGGASLVFPTCQATDRPGHFAFGHAANNDFEDLAASAARLGFVVPCSGTPSPLAHRSGGYYPPGRSGEGLFVHYLPAGNAVLIFYSYTPTGEQFWAISGEVSIDGDTLTAQMLFPALTTRFGSRFDPTEIELQPWGQVTLTHLGCDSAQFTHDSIQPGYGSGSHEYVRLTQLLGTGC